MTYKQSFCFLVSSIFFVALHGAVQAAPLDERDQDGYNELSYEISETYLAIKALKDEEEAFRRVYFSANDDLTGTWKGNWTSSEYPHPIEVHVWMENESKGLFTLAASSYCFEGEVIVNGERISFEGDECEGDGWLSVSGTQWPFLGLLRLHGDVLSEVTGFEGDWAMTLYRVDELPMNK